MTQRLPKNAPAPRVTSRDDGFRASGTRSVAGALWYSREKRDGRSHPMRRLLVVEDDARLRDELCVLLARNGFYAELYNSQWAV